MAAKGIQFPWRWDSGIISTRLDVIWGMRVKNAGVVPGNNEEYDFPTKGIRVYLYAVVMRRTKEKARCRVQRTS
jgi:hypothetical protein